jgi:hypothetical protein
MAVNPERLSGERGSLVKRPLDGLSSGQESIWRSVLANEEVKEALKPELRRSYKESLLVLMVDPARIQHLCSSLFDGPLTARIFDKVYTAKRVADIKRGRLDVVGRSK